MSTSALIFQTQSILIVLLMYFGVLKRANRDLHVKIMSSVILWDILLILQIELTRGAIAKAQKVLTNHVLLNIHVSFAVTAVVLYVLMIFTGRKILKGNRKIRSWHFSLGITTLIIRTLTLVTSFFTIQ